MCGIVGGVALNRDITPVLLECLSKLEYRGYDSAGIAIVDKRANEALQRVRAVGKIANLKRAVEANPPQGTTGIAHTRWATHGAPTENNAHPHFSQETIGLVHNGIIENYLELRQELIDHGYNFASETDTEVVAHYIHKYHEDGLDFLAAVHKTAKSLHGMYSLAIVNSTEPNRIVAVRCGSPLVVGIGENECFLASDRLALTGIAQKFIYLEDGDIADLTPLNITLYDANLQKVDRPIHNFTSTCDIACRGNYKHYMLKEIFEQTRAISDVLEDRMEVTNIADNIFGEKAEKVFPEIKKIQIAACGTSFHAGLVARYWLEEFASLPCQVDIASELRYKKTVVEPDTLFVAISQSGETADTLAVVKQAQNQNYKALLSICNVAESSLVRETCLNFFTRAGVEIGVASTKAFTSQLIALFLLTLALGKHNGLSINTATRLIQQLKHLPSSIESCLALNDKIAKIAEHFSEKQHALFLGRGPLYPIALEGALKMKEISYIHAEAYAAGELKHGPLALVDKNMPVVVIAPNDDLLPKIKSNIQEVEARGGEIFAITENNIDLNIKSNIEVLRLPSIPKEMAPIVYVVPLQLLAYHVALLKGTDVDQPRNLAKSVTVE